MTDPDAVPNFFTRLSVRSPLYWLLAAAPAVLLVILILPRHIWPVWRASIEPQKTVGRVVAQHCERARINYTYDVAGTSYSGEGRPRDIGVRCEQLTRGREIPVVFSAVHPASSVATENIRHVLTRRLRALVIAAAVAYVGMAAALAAGHYVAVQMAMRRVEES
jgi:hypothetical protein